MKKCIPLVAWSRGLNGVSLGTVDLYEGQAALKYLLLSSRKGWNVRLSDALSSPHTDASLWTVSC
jgi:hypothetical protein